MQSTQDRLMHGMLEQGQASALLLTAAHTIRQAQQMHQLSPTATCAMGQLMMAALLTASDIKYEQGDITAVWDGGGPSGKLIAVASPKGTVRATMTHPEAEAPLKGQGKPDVPALVGNQGRLTVIKDNGGREPYIGQIALETGDIALEFARYFVLSEQRPCLLYTGVMVGPQGEVESAGALAVFPMPGCPEEVLTKLEGISRPASLLSFLLSEGMDLSECAGIVFPDMSWNVTQTIPVQYLCNCSRERMERALASVGQQELRDMIEQDGGAEITCHFCNTSYTFTGQELETLLHRAV